MKTVITTLIFLYTISSAAQSMRYNDGSYYNDDYIRNGSIMPDVPTANNYRTPSQGVMVGEPDPNGHQFPRKKFKLPKQKRKPSGGFQEVKSSDGSVGSFKEVGGGESSDQSDSLGSK